MDRRSCLSRDLNRLVNNELYSDIKYITSDGKSIFGHKVILFSRSRKLYEEFQSQAQISSSNVTTDLPSITVLHSHLTFNMLCCIFHYLVQLIL